MASYKLNLATVSRMPGRTELHALMAGYGCPAAETAGLIDAGTSEAANESWATLVAATRATIQKLNTTSNVVEEREIEKSKVYPFKLRGLPSDQDTGVLEVYVGGAKTITVVGGFLVNDLATAMEVRPIPLNMLAKINDIRTAGFAAEIKAASVSNYRHSDDIVGTYTAKFHNSAEGEEFVTAMEGNDTSKVRSVTVAFKITKKVRITLTPFASFSYSCDRDDAPAVGKLLRGLVGVG